MNSRWLRAKPSFPHHWFSGSLRGSEVCNQPSSAPTKHLTQDTTNTSSLKRTDLPPWVLTWWELVRAGNNPGGLRSAFFSCSLTDADELNDPHFWYHSPGCGDSCYLPNRPLFWPRGGSVKQQRLILVACMYTEHKVSKMFQNTLNEHPFRLSPVLL